MAVSNVVPQMEHMSGELKPVLCRWLRALPQRDAATGRMELMPLPLRKVVLQVVVETWCGADARKYCLRMIEEQGNVKYAWQRVGSGERGVITEFNSREECVTCLVPRMGRDFTDMVLELFRWRRPLCLSQ